MVGQLKASAPCGPRRARAYSCRPPARGSWPACPRWPLAQLAPLRGRVSTAGSALGPVCRPTLAAAQGPKPAAGRSQGAIFAPPASTWAWSLAGVAGAASDSSLLLPWPGPGLRANEGCGSKRVLCRERKRPGLVSRCAAAPREGRSALGADPNGHETRLRRLSANPRAVQEARPRSPVRSRMELEAAPRSPVR